MKKQIFRCVIVGYVAVSLVSCGSTDNAEDSNSIATDNQTVITTTATTADPKIEEYETLQGKFDYVIDQAVKRSDGAEFIIRDYDKYYTNVTWYESGMGLDNSSSNLPSCAITYSSDHSEINFTYDDSVHVMLHPYMGFIYRDLGVTIDINDKFDTVDSFSIDDGLITITGEKGEASLNQLGSLLGEGSISGLYSYKVTLKLNKP